MTDSPDLGIQTNIVQKTNLPLLDQNNQYLFRYRVKTLDGAVVSSWSTIHRVTKPSIATLTYTVQKEIKSHGKSFDVSWKLLPSIPEQIKDLPLDVYVKWHNEETWKFVTTTSTNSFSVPIPTEYQSTMTNTYTASFMVHLATLTKNKTSTDTNTLVFVANNISTMAVYDSGKIA